MTASLNNSPFVFDTYQKKDEVDKKGKFIDSNLKNFNTNDNNENIDNDITSLSIPSDKEDYFNLYKLPKNKVINNILSIETNIEKLNENKKRNIIKIRIIKPKNTNQKNNIDNKITNISILNEESSISQKYSLFDKIKSENNNIDKFKKRQIKFKQKMIQNLKKFIEENQKKNKYAHINNYNTNKTEKIKKTFTNNTIKIKMRSEKYSKNKITNIKYIFKKIKKRNKTPEKNSLSKNNNKSSVISLTIKNYDKKINMNYIFFKKSNPKNINKTPNKFNQSSPREQIKNIYKQQEKQGYFFVKKIKNVNFKTNEVSSYLTSNNSIENSNNIKFSRNRDNNKYFFLSKSQGIFLYKSKMNYTSSNIKKKELIILRNANKVIKH